MRSSPTLATVIRATFGIPPEEGMNPQGTPRSPVIEERVSKDPPCSRRENPIRRQGLPFPPAWTSSASFLLLPFPDLQRSNPRSLPPPDSVHSFPFPRYRRPLATAVARFCPGGVRPMEGPAVRSPRRGGVLDGFWPPPYPGTSGEKEKVHAAHAVLHLRVGFSDPIGR